jgi:DNA-binding LytR/AlgR family response regulator
MNRVTAILAEDEAPQRDSLAELLGDLWPALELCAVCEDGLSALEALAAHRPQLAILDIRMPGLSGLEVARSAIAGGTHVLFTTAYDEYAVRAFEAGAVDYVLKPLRRDRLAVALERVRERIRGTQPAPVLPERLPASEAAGTLQWITAQLGDTVRLLGIDEVLYFHAQDKLTRVVTAHGEALIRTPLKELLAQLDSQQFWQVHRSVIVRVAQIAAFEKNDLGRHELCLRDRPERLPVAQAFASRLRSM